MSSHTDRDTSTAGPRGHDRIRDRHHGLDWLRGLAAILVVMLHAAIPYLAHPMPGLIWSAPFSERSAALDLLGWWIDGFIMPVFFLTTGFFAARLFKLRGPHAFLSHRISRIGGPLLFGMVVILPLDLYAWLLGWINADLIPVEKLRSLKVRGELGVALWGVSHLWYLQYVLVYSAGAWLLHRLVRDLGGVEPRMLNRFWARLPQASGLMSATAAAAVCSAVLWWQPRIVIGFRQGWFPAWENLVYYAMPFLLGWIWERHAHRPERAPWEWHARLAAGTALFILLWPRLQLHLNAESMPVQDLWVPCLFAGFGICMATGVFGLALSLRFDRAWPAISYLSRASFWIYLFHHPIVGLTHVDFALVSWPPVLEFLLTTAVTLTLCLLTYEAGVRRTWVGQLLNGCREPARIELAPLPAAAAQVGRRAA